jgi:integrase
VPGFLDLLRTDEELCRLDIGDLLAFMIFTGCRIGEALDLRWSRVDLEHGTVTFGSTVVRVRGAGLASRSRARRSRQPERSRSRTQRWKCAGAETRHSSSSCRR